MELKSPVVPEAAGIRLRFAPPIDLAINAIEVADLVGIEVHADQNPAAAARQDRIDELIFPVRSPVVREQRQQLIGHRNFQRKRGYPSIIGL